MPKIFEGIRVLDLSQFISGPWGAIFLGDQGAEVIKVESPGLGEAMRVFVFYNKQIAPLFAILNRNKKSVTLDLRKPEGQEVLKELVKVSDVLIENFTPGIMDRWGIGYDVLKEINPRLIYAAISGYGQTGPLRNRPACHGNNRTTRDSAWRLFSRAYHRNRNFPSPLLAGKDGKWAIYRFIYAGYDVRSKYPCSIKRIHRYGQKSGA
jgi:hypothetical protein